MAGAAAAALMTTSSGAQQQRAVAAPVDVRLMLGSPRVKLNDTLAATVLIGASQGSSIAIRGDIVLTQGVSVVASTPRGAPVRPAIPLAGSPPLPPPGPATPIVRLHDGHVYVVTETVPVGSLVARPGRYILRARFF